MIETIINSMCGLLPMIPTETNINCMIRFIPVHATIIAIVINSYIVLILGKYAIKYRNTSSYVIFILFIYISLHYSYSMIAIFGDSPYFILFTRYLYYNTQIGIKIIGFGFLLFITGLIVFTKYHVIISQCQFKLNKCIYYFIIFWFLTVCISWIISIFQGEYPSFLAFQDVISNIMMLILAFIISITLFDTNEEVAYHLQKILYVLLLLVILMDVLSIYQTAMLKTFAGTTKANGDYERRACALLFNPNVLGLWFVLIASVTAYAFHTKIYSKIKTFFMLALIALGIFLSGSRSSLLICLFMLGFSSFLQLKFRRWGEIKLAFYPLFLFLSSLIGMSIVFKIIDTMTDKSYVFLHALSILVDRFVSMGKEIYFFAIFKLTGYAILVSGWLYELTEFSIFNYAHNFSDSASKKLTVTSVSVNIEGRLNPALAIPDNGYIGIYHDTGLPGLIVWLLLWMAIVWCGVKSYRINPCINSVYALSAVCTCLFAAIFIRLFQVYPLWIMVAIVLGLSLSWFQTVLGQKSINENS